MSFALRLNLFTVSIVISKLLVVTKPALSILEPEPVSKYAYLYDLRVLTLTALLFNVISVAQFT
jgi:hypothetical protein